jgi:hypothetical protein
LGDCLRRISAYLEFQIHLLVFAWNSSFELQRLHIDPVNGKLPPKKKKKGRLTMLRLKIKHLVPNPHAAAIIH